MYKVLAITTIALALLAGSLYMQQGTKLQASGQITFGSYLNSVAEQVNQMQTTWTATTYPRWANMDYVTIKGMMGALQAPEYLSEYYAPEVHNEIPNDIPANFQSAEQWPNCPSISEIRDQANCGSCWAVGGATAMTDRYCVAKGDGNWRISYQNLLSCCAICGFGCNGGFPIAGWIWWTTQGLTSGDKYQDYQYCQPYTVKPCGLSCPSTIEPTPKCLRECDPAYTGSVAYKDTFTHGSAYNIKGVENIQADILKNGPVEAAFTVYADFMQYKSGIYKHVSGQQLGGHAVRIVGWGEENGTPYWTIANSWSEQWGENGTFRILRGSNECGIEAGIVAGIPQK